MSTQPSGQQSESNAPGTHGGGSGGADPLNPLSMLADLESRISGLKKMHEQSASRETVLNARELELVAKEREHAARSEQVALKERDLALQGEQFKREQEELRQQQARLEEERRELAQQKQAAQGERERAEREARERAQREIEQREHAVEERHAARAKELADIERRVGEREAAIAARESSLAHRDSELALRESTLRERDRGLNDLAQRIEKLEAELDQREAKVGESERKLGDKERWLVELEASVEKRRSEAEESQRAAQDLDKELSERDARLSQREDDVSAREKASAELNVRQQAMAAMEAQLDQRQSELREQIAQIDRGKAEILERERALAASAISEETSAIYAGRAEELQLKLGEASSARAALQSEVEHLREEISQTKKKLEAASTRPSESELTAARKLAEDFKRQVSDSEDALAQSEAKVRELQTSMRELSEKAKGAAAAEQLGDENERLKRELGARDEAIVQRERSLEDAESRVKTLQKEVADAKAALAKAASAVQSGASSADIEKRDQAIGLLKQRVDKLTEQNAALNAKAQQAELRYSELEAKLAAGGSQSEESSHDSGGVSERWVLRQQRLKSYKKLLQTQARKIVAAQAALQKRHADCEQVLSQRAKVAAMSENLVRREKRMAASKARSGAAATLAYSVATLGLLAGLSWEVSRRIWPGTYIARATVEMEVRDRSVEPAQAVEWQKDMEQLVQDPRLMEVVSERMKRRGFESLGSAAEVRDLISKSLYTQSTQAGKLEFELRGEGQERSQVLLDTFVTAFKSVADESKGERAHDIGVNITAPAAASSTPLWDQRLQQTGMVFGGSVLLAGILGMFAYSRLQAGKKAFDQKTLSDSSFGDVDWATLEASFKKNAGPSDKKAA